MIEISFSYIFWIDSTSEDTVIQSLKEIYKKTASPGTQVSSFNPAVVLNQISSLKSQWLLIFDNADDSPELVENFLPPGNKGNILITSRNPKLKRVTTHQNSMEVVEMNEMAAIELLLKASGHSEKDRKKAQQIVQMLHGLPLAIDMAGAYITKTQCDLDDFIRMYKKYSSKILNNTRYHGPSKYNKSVYETWEISIQKILKMCNNTQDKVIAAAAQYAMILLNIFAFMHYENISEEIFERAVKYYPKNKNRFADGNLPTYLPIMDGSILNMDEIGDWNSWLFIESIELLLSCSLVKKNTKRSTYTMNPLVQSFCEDRLSFKEKDLWIYNTAGLILSSL
ncbi:hypothetical protein BDQ17DRAFT_1268110, partial [Cyathus striatus]